MINTVTQNITVKISTECKPKVPSISYSSGINPFTNTVINQVYNNYTLINNIIYQTNSIYNIINTISNSISTIYAANVIYYNDGYPTVNTVEDALNLILYVNPTVSITNNIGTVELGSTVNNITLTWSTNKSIESQTLTDIGSLNASLRNYSITSANLTIDKTYTITVYDTKNYVSSSTSILFRNRRFWGTSSSTSLNQSQVLNLSNELSGSRNQTRNFNPNNEYLYFAWPSRFGTPTFIVGGLTNTAWIKNTLSLTNNSGYTENYDVYRSTFLQNGTQQVIVQ